PGAPDGRRTSCSCGGRWPRSGATGPSGSANWWGRSSRRQADAELLEAWPDAIGEETQSRQVRDHRAVHVPLEVLAKRRVVVRRGRLAAVALDLGDLLGGARA